VSTNTAAGLTLSSGVCRHSETAYLLGMQFHSKCVFDIFPLFPYNHGVRRRGYDRKNETGTSRNANLIDAGCDIGQIEQFMKFLEGEGERSGPVSAYEAPPFSA